MSFSIIIDGVESLYIQWTLTYFPSSAWKKGQLVYKKQSTHEESFLSIIITDSVVYSERSTNISKSSKAISENYFLFCSCPKNIGLNFSKASDPVQCFEGPRKTGTLPATAAAERIIFPTNSTEATWTLYILRYFKLSLFS